MSGTCHANMNLSDDEFMITCDRGDHDSGLHYWQPRELWWYSDIWLPVVSQEVLAGAEGHPGN